MSFLVYFWILKAYQDLRGNQEAEVLVAPIRFDIETLDFTVQSPVTNTRLALESTVTFALPEDALPGSVQLKFTRTPLELGITPTLVNHVHQSPTLQRVLL